MPATPGFGRFTTKVTAWKRGLTSMLWTYSGTLVRETDLQYMPTNRYLGGPRPPEKESVYLLKSGVLVLSSSCQFESASPN